MSADTKGRDLFIVDNSVSGWTGLRYLEEWTGIARSFDIATGYFEIGAMLALDGKWQSLEKIRVLMGAETTYRTRKVMLERPKACSVRGGSAPSAVAEAYERVWPGLRCPQSAIYAAVFRSLSDSSHAS